MQSWLQGTVRPPRLRSTQSYGYDIHEEYSDPPSSVHAILDGLLAVLT